MAPRNQTKEDPTTTLEVDENGHVTGSDDPLVLAEWYATHDQLSMAILCLIRHAAGGDTPGEAARTATSSTDETGE